MVGALSRVPPVRVLLLASVLLVACGEESLYSRLGEQEANEMIALLSEAGLSATKSGNVDGEFTVTVPSDAFAAAVAVLQRNGLPRMRYETIGDVFAREGFVSSPLEERARLNFALSQEIAHTLSSIDGVVLARVHLAVPQRDDLDDEVPLASASVFIKHRHNVDLSGSVGQIKALVVDGIENLSYDDVTVVLFATDSRATPGGGVPLVPAASSSANATADAPTTLRASAGEAATGTPMVAGVGALPVLFARIPLAGGIVAASLLALLGGLCVWFGWFRRRPDRAGSR